MKEPPSAASQEIDSASADRAGTDIAVTAAVAGAGLDRAWIEASLRRAAAQVAHPVARVHVLLVDDARMDAFHRKHSGVAGTTDVLTFPESSPGEPIAVDIVACVDEARSQAAGRGHSVERELVLYALHGLLHCAGHDDHDPAAYRRMHAEEDRILAAIGVGETFAPAGDHPDRLPEDGADR